MLASSCSYAPLDQRVVDRLKMYAKYIVSHIVSYQFTKSDDLSYLVVFIIYKWFPYDVTSKVVLITLTCKLSCLG